MISASVLKYVLAASVAFSGTSGARLQKTGEVARAMKERPVPMLLLTVLYGLSGLAALFYFSWAHLSWSHLLVFIVVWVTLADKIARANSGVVVWSAFICSVLFAAASEVLLVMGF